jgi:thiosulfate dehydrogenase
MKKFLSGLILGVCLVPALAYLYIRLGYAPVATSAPPLPLERSLAHMALQARIAKEAPAEVPVPASEANLVAGAKIYRQDCALCHGLSGQPPSDIARGMFPRVPQLFRGKGVTDDPVGETYWKATYGIRLSGMPAFMGTLTNEQLWQVSLLLANADKLPASAKQALSNPPEK